MFLKKIQIRNRIFLEIVEGKRTLNNQVKHIVIQKLGFLDELPFDLEYYQKQVEELNQKKKEIVKIPNFENVYACLCIGSLFIKAIYEKYGWNRISFPHKTRSENQITHQKIEELIYAFLTNQNKIMDYEDVQFSNQFLNQGITLLNRKIKEKRKRFIIYIEKMIPFPYQLLFSLNQEYQVLDTRIEFSTNKIDMDKSCLLFENRMMQKNIFVNSNSKFITRASIIWNKNVDDYIQNDSKKRRFNVNENAFYYVLPRKEIVVHNLTTHKVEKRAVQILLVFDESHKRKDEDILKYDFENAQNCYDEFLMNQNQNIEEKFLLSPRYDEWMKTTKSASIDIDKIKELQKYVGYYYLITDDLEISHQALMEVNLFCNDVNERLQFYQKGIAYQTQVYAQVIEIVFLQFMRIKLSMMDLSILELKKCLNQYRYLLLDEDQYLFYLESPKFAEILKKNQIQLLLGICSKKQIHNVVQTIMQRI